MLSMEAIASTLGTPSDTLVSILAANVDITQTLSSHLPTPDDVIAAAINPDAAAVAAASAVAAPTSNDAYKEALKGLTINIKNTKYKGSGAAAAGNGSSDDAEAPSVSVAASGDAVAAHAEGN